MATDRNDIRLSSKYRQLLGELAKKEGSNPSQVLEQALDAFAGRQANGETRSIPGVSLYDAAKKLGLIGCVKGGPADMSTNPKYMEGFGENH